MENMISIPYVSRYMSIFLIFLTNKFTYLIGRALTVNVVIHGCSAILRVIARSAVRFGSFTEKLSESRRLRGRATGHLRPADCER